MESGYFETATADVNSGARNRFFFLKYGLQRTYLQIVGDFSPKKEVGCAKFITSVFFAVPSVGSLSSLSPSIAELQYFEDGDLWEMVHDTKVYKMDIVRDGPKRQFTCKNVSN